MVRTDEWTAAAEGSQHRAYPWGNDAPTAERLDACGAECAAMGMYPSSDGWVATAPRGTYAGGATPEGVLDLAGNVAEWTTNGDVRGGSYADTDPAAVTAQATHAVDPNAQEPTIGFRCAIDP